MKLKFLLLASLVACSGSTFADYVDEEAMNRLSYCAYDRVDGFTKAMELLDSRGRRLPEIRLMLANEILARTNLPMGDSGPMKATDIADAAMVSCAHIIMNSREK
ncbi:hypothetical protein [Vibrio caribbeanicus]|uniref:Lipoprotein n=1 Tax=Vibrio caribbeanicus ATCC BAA-2122 TaxID=796620 RepID=E3BHA7_9VIBR|nr:hypothetical protein [Vibrio caribbeanicus]EFP97555.1 hypothetical protein VIBC2010_17739 [Vibrio caribbeanicus ATCC BAA-2122]